MNKNLEKLLKRELNHLSEALSILKRSYQICQSITKKENYPIEELDHLEALTSRFGRLSDLLVQKVFRMIDELELESPGTARDRINRAEKRGLISSAELFIKIRLLRNEIAHEYLPEEIRRIFAHVIGWTPELIASVEKVQKFCKKYEC